MLVYYIHHITDSIRIDTIMRVVKKGTLATLERLHPTRDNGSPAEVHDIPPQTLIVGARSSGYVQDYHVEPLVEQARTRHAVVAFIHPVGHHLVRGRPLAHVWPAPENDATAQRNWDTWVDQAVSITDERSIKRDMAFGVRQLVDIAIKAVGPSINDPYTSVQAIQHLSVILVEIAGRTLDAGVDTGSNAQVVIPVSSFDSYLHLVCSHIRQEAANRPRVMVALLRLLEDVMASTTNSRRQTAIVEEAELVVEEARHRITQAADLEELLRVADSLRKHS